MIKKVIFICMVIICFCFANLSKTIEFNSDLLTISAVKTVENSNRYLNISYNNNTNTSIPGEPQLPIISKNYLISENDIPIDVDFKINKMTEFKLDALIEPGQNTTINELLPPNEDIYYSNSLYPQTPIKIFHDGWMDGNHIVNIAFYPVQYNPLDNKIYFIESISFKIKTKNNLIKPRRVSTRSSAMQSIYDKTLETIIANPEDISAYQVKPLNKLMKTESSKSISFNYEYIVITADSLKPAFDDFIEWKKRAGINIGIISIESILNSYSIDLQSFIEDDAGALRQYIYDAYDCGCTYILLGGDDTIIPIRKGTYFNEETPSDLYFSDLNGNWDSNGNGVYGEVGNQTTLYDQIDIFPEIFTGRLTANNSTEITNWIAKQLIYEQDPGRGDPNYLKNVLITQADQHQGLNTAAYIKSVFENNGLSTMTIEECPSNNDVNPISPLPSTIIDEMNTAYGISCFFNHGSRLQIAVKTSGTNGPRNGNGEITTFDDEPGGSTGSGFENLVNYNKPGICHSSSCSCCGYDGEYQYYTNSGHIHKHDFSEMYLCYSKGGGIAFLGNTRDSNRDASPQICKKTFINAIENHNNLGIAYAVAKTQTSTGLTNNAYQWHYFNLFGCPGTKIWTDIPSEFSNISIIDNTTSITVDAGETGCTICVSAENPDNFWQIASNTQSSTFNTSTRPLHIVITKENKLPYINLHGLNNITGNLTLNNSFAYTIKNDIIVTSTGVLNIEAGTTLKFCENKELKVYGELNINGTYDSPVVLTSDAPNVNPGYWDGIHAYPAAEVNAYYANISNSTYGIYSAFSKLNVNFCEITNNNYGIKVHCCTGNRSASIGKTTFTNNNYGIYFYSSEGSIVSNNISGGSIGIYTNGNITVKSNKLNTFTYDAIRCQNYDGNIQFNNISDCRYGIYFMSSSSGDMMNTWQTHLSKISAKNNIFSTPMNSCIFVSSTATPNIGTYSDMFIEVDAGWNEFCNPTYYDIHSLYSGAIKAEGNWWNTRATSGSIVYTPIAENISSNLLKAINSNETDAKFKQAYQLEKNRLYQNAIDIYKALIKENVHYNITITQKAINRMRGCYRQMKHYNILNETLTNIYLAYPNTYTGYYANYLNSTQYILEKNHAKALQILDESYQGFVSLEKAETAAFVIYDKIILLDYIINMDEEELHKSTYSNMLNECKETLLESYGDSEAAALLKELLNYTEPLLNDIPNKYELKSLYPNPFNPIVNIPYDLPEKTQVTINIYDIAGRKIHTLINKIQNPGSYNINFNASQLASGVYIVNFSSPNYNNSRKMLFLK